MSQVEVNAGRSLREIHCAARRERILTAARRLIVRGGVPALSMRKLAAEAGLAVTTLYNLFGARDDILCALINDAIDRMDEVLEQEAPLDDPLDRCRAVVTVSVRHLAQNAELFRPMLLAGFHGGPLDATSANPISARAARMQGVAIEAAIAQGLLHSTLEPDLLGCQIYHGYEMASLQWALGAIGAEHFESRALYGLYVALLAVATKDVRPEIEGELRRLERALGSGRRRKGRVRRSA